MTVKDLIHSLERGRGSMFIFFFFNAKMRIGAWDEEGGKKNMVKHRGKFRQFLTYICTKKD